MAGARRCIRQVLVYGEVNTILIFFCSDFASIFSRSPLPLSSDERKRHEYIDCQLIELIRIEILTFANVFPTDFMQRIIDLLNKGTINTSDPKDVFGSLFIHRRFLHIEWFISFAHIPALDSYQQRTELSRACFDALLSTSQVGPDIVQCSVTSTASLVGESTRIHIGTSAITSLVSRCKQVIIVSVLI